MAEYFSVIRRILDSISKSAIILKVNIFSQIVFQKYVINNVK